MGSLVLYSTNVFLKLLIQRKYQADIHYVWCSEEFDASKLPAYSFNSLTGASSNPVDIYRDLKRAVTTNDQHNHKVNEQKASLKSLAIAWADKGTIAEIQKDEILYMVDHAPMDHWRPLIYIIPYAPIAARAKLVAIDKRAGFGEEYIIEDLKASEFHVIEI